MGWFDEQIRQRIRDDEEILDQAYLELSSVVLGRSVMTAALNDDKKKTENAFEEILKYFRVKPTQVPDAITDMDERLEFLLRPSGVMRRTVTLKGRWYRDGVGPLIGQTAAGDTVALIPGRFSGYTYFDYALGKPVRVTRRNAENIRSQAICFYRPLPQTPMGKADIFRYMAKTLSRGDVLLIAVAALSAALLGMVTPYATRAIFNQIVPSGRVWLLGSIGCLLAGAAVGKLGLSIIKDLLVDRVQTKISVSTEAALMARVISLPTAFFKRYSAGELANRAAGVEGLCVKLVQVVFSLGLTAVFSLVYIAQAFTYAPAMALPALALVAVNGLWIWAAARGQMALNVRKAEADARLEGMVYGLYSGIQKIKLSGAERRAFGKWASAYRESARCTYDPPLLLKLAPAVAPVLTMAGTILLYFCALNANVAAADYLAFSTAYGQVSAALTAMGPATLLLGSVLPVIGLLEPVLAQTPEVSTGKRMVTRLSGGIEVSHVSFRYSEDMPLILDDLSLKIRPGQYVAVVGSTGCGKSTLLRLLLGFETPQKGAVYYDGKDLQSVDLKSLRQRIGVVLQNSTLLSGSILQNIVVASPRLTVEDAWAAAEAAGIADDIRAMPMGMNTVISEGGGGISGGQKQRLMIARAIASKPKILMFDEATSALDNLTQKLVSQSLDNLKSTRIVIAHRLSTIRQCDRIIVLDKGKIVEDGNYEELVAQKGFFAGLVERQQLGGPGFVEKTTIF